MKKRGKLLLASLLMGILISAVPVLANNTVSSDDIDSQKKTEANQGDEAWKMSDEEIMRELSAKASNYSGIQTEGTKKKYLFLGDSISCEYTDIYGNQVRPYVYHFSQVNSAEIVCKGVGGATMSSVYSPNMMEQLNSVALNSFDAVFIYYGVNDFCTGVTIGDCNTTDVNTTCGALRSAIKKCQAAGTKVYVILPVPCLAQFKNQSNINGDYYPAFVSAIRKTAETNGVSIVDFYSQLGVNKDNYESLYVDNVHPNDILQQKAGLYLNQVLSADKDPVDQNATLQFVIRLYNNCLSRDPDDSGAKYWYDLLVSREKTGAEVGSGFFFSKEFLEHNYTNREYVELLYLTMMDRTYDEAGLNGWVDLLDNGISRLYVYKGFAMSQEYSAICDRYGIESGSVDVSEPRDQNIGLTQFVARLYTKALGREYDVDGLNDWCNRVLTGNATVTTVSTDGFFHSQEFINKNLSDEEFVKVLYRTFLNREYDEVGFQDWTTQLKNGVSRDEVIKGFAYSDEFIKIKASYGLK